MLWFWLALSTAFFQASEAAALKKWFGDLPPLAMSTVMLLYSLPFFALALPFVWQTPGDGFWTVMAVLLPLNALAYLLNMTAINVAPLSLVMPYLSFTPVFAALFAWPILGEEIPPLGWLGIAITVAGSWVLNLEGNGRRVPVRERLLAPFTALASEPGARCMLGTALLYGITSVLGKQLLRYASPAFAGVVFFLCLSFLVLAGLTLAGRLDRALVRTLVARPAQGGVMGLMALCHNLAHMAAVALAPVAYMISVKRLSGIFGVLYGGLLFDEKNVRLRLMGAVLMCLGAVAVTLAG